MRIRATAVAGRFYSDEQDTLNQHVRALLSDSQYQSSEPLNNQVEGVRGLIVPHAGYVYSGRVAGVAYRLLKPLAESIKRVILVGPSHRARFDGVAIPTCAQFATPLGLVDLDRDALALLAQSPNVIRSNDAHAQEHSLEVQIPFLQECLKEFRLVPMVTCITDYQTVAELIAPIWDAQTLLVISTDLSHFHTYEQCQALDASTCEKIELLQSDITPHEACGSMAVNAALHLILQSNYQLKPLMRINSGDTKFGDKDRVVGYASYAICQ
ncbi:AmmeMemoRadiSam system protein B [Vibrio sp. WXL103]|uniref:AmmeMemoRadiSam system protein B n=1 Tax=Vibrio sp. WXL103 TaxID=3450710 RepID=UPI003EC85138